MGGKKSTEMETSTVRVEAQFEMSNVLQEGQSGKISIIPRRNWETKFQVEKRVFFNKSIKPGWCLMFETHHTVKKL